MSSLAVPIALPQPFLTLSLSRSFSLSLSLLQALGTEKHNIMATRSRIRKLQTGSSNRTSFSSLKQLRSSVSLRGSGLHSAQPGSSKDATAIVPGRIRPSSQGSRAASAAKSRTRSIRGSSAMQRSLSTSQGTASHASLRPSTSSGSVRMGMVRSASSASATGKNQRSKRGRPA